MEYRKLTFLVFLIFTYFAVNAQENKFAVANSTVQQLYNAGDWKQLISFGNKTLADSVDFPELHFKMGYAYMVTGNYKAAISQFNTVLHHDSFNSAARLYAYYCNTYLNDDVGASYQTSFIDKATLTSLKLSPFGLIDAELESGIKLPNNSQRDNGFFERVGLSNRLGWRLQLEQSALLFKQNILRGGYRDRENQTGRDDKQYEYFGKTKLAITNSLSILGSYHYLHTSYRSNIYNSNLGLLGVKYTGQYINLQGDFNFGKLIDKTLKQYNAKLDFYPLGNLNFYTISRASILNLSGASSFIYSQAIGFKLLSKTWLETSATFGNQDDYLDADGLYVYNSIDPTKFKCGETVFYQLSSRALLNLNYIYERKSDVYRPVKYNQNSITLALTWKF